MVCPYVGPWEFDGELSEPDQSTWLLAKFSLLKEAGNWIDVEMIRPAEYWESQRATPGSHIFMEFPELEASGMAVVRSIEPCPPIPEGAGNVVTARIVTRQVSELVEIEFGEETLTGTPQHPIWSIERQDWVELGDLEIGEHLWTEAGPIEVLSIRLVSTAESVYNLEVHGHHIYQVGELGVLVHNQYPTYKKYEVYIAKWADDTLEYAGITTNYAVREAYHLNKHTREIIKVASGLGKRQARYLEHLLIQHQLKNVSNIQKGIHKSKLKNYTKAQKQAAQREFDRLLNSGKIPRLPAR